MKYCGKCGAPLREGKGFCPGCGAEVRRPEPAQVAVKEKRPGRGAGRLAAALIVLVLIGGLGAAGWYWGLPYVCLLYTSASFCTPERVQKGGGSRVEG